MTMTEVKIDRISLDALGRFADNNEQPAGVSLWLCQVAEAVDANDRSAAWDAVLASAPLSERDVDYLTSLCDAIAAGEEVVPDHQDVDWSDVEPGDEFKVACSEILYARAKELLSSPYIRYWR